MGAISVISKSKFASYKTCPKSLWLNLYKKGEYVENEQMLSLAEKGKEVGDLAKRYFPNTEDVTTRKADNALDIEKMIELTDFLLRSGKQTIAEASFCKDGLFCSVDLLHRVEGGYEIYEVKATTNVEKEHVVDAAFQKCVLQKSGLKIKKVSILHLNKDYRRKGSLSLKQLFISEQIDDNKLFLKTLNGIDNDVKDIQNLVSSKNEPIVKLSPKCKKCPFKGYCQKGIQTPSVLDVNRLRGYGLLNKGVVTYQDLLSANVKLNKRQRVQIGAELNGKTTIIDKKAIEVFLNSIRYPVYHLDFETTQNAIPQSDGAWPYEQIPTQYSLHIEYQDGTLEHKDFLGNSMDPRREIAESLCKDIPEDACVTAYNKDFECTRLKELADLYPDLRDHLLNIKNNIVDLLVPFKEGSYYHKNMGGSNSIKAVLPALYPNDPDLDYHALEEIHNGGEAMNAYPVMLNSSPEEKQRLRDCLLKYCRLDTLAMFKVLQKLKEAIV